LLKRIVPLGRRWT